MKLEQIVDDLSDRSEAGEPERVEHRVAEGTTPFVAGGRRRRGVTMVAGLAGGAVLTVFGALALARGDTSGSWNEPIVEVNGWPHSPMLGLLQILAGATLIALSMSAIGELLAGVVIRGFGAIALMEPTVLDGQLTIATAHAGLLVAIGAIAMLASVIAMRLRRRPGTRAYMRRRSSKGADDAATVVE